MILKTFLGERTIVYNGKSKDIYTGVCPNTLIINFKSDRGSLRNKISSIIFRYLEKLGIKHHFIKILNIKEQLIHTAQAYPLFVKVHNIVHEEIGNRLGIELGTILKNPLIEWHLKSSYLNDPIVSQEHICCFEWITKEEINQIIELSKKINYILKAMFIILGLDSAMAELHFGCINHKELILISDISPDTILFWGEFESITEDLAYKKMQEIPNR